MRDSFNDFLSAGGDRAEGFPQNLDELSKTAGLRLVLADNQAPRFCFQTRGERLRALLSCMHGYGVLCRQDPDQIGIVQWRVSFYVAGEDGAVLNALMLFDEYFAWKAKQMAKDRGSFVVLHHHPGPVGDKLFSSPRGGWWCWRTVFVTPQEIEVHIYTHPGVDFDSDKFKEETSYEHYTFHLNAEDMPLKWNEAGPCIGKRVVSMHLCAQSETALKIVWSGNTWSYRDAMDTHEIKGPPRVAIGTARAYLCAR